VSLAGVPQIPEEAHRLFQRGFEELADPELLDFTRGGIIIP
jgi:hypothetical protein